MFFFVWIRGTLPADPLRPVHDDRLEGADPGLAGVDRARRRGAGAAQRRGPVAPPQVLLWVGVPLAVVLIAAIFWPSRRERDEDALDEDELEDVERTRARGGPSRTGTSSPEARGRYPVPPLDLKVPVPPIRRAGEAERWRSRARRRRRGPDAQDPARSELPGGQRCRFLIPSRDSGSPSPPCSSRSSRRTTRSNPEQPAPRYHGRHQLNRHPDGLEKCVGCELCAWACPADAIFVEGGGQHRRGALLARASGTGRTTRSTTCAASAAACASRPARPAR